MNITIKITPAESSFPCSDVPTQIYEITQGIPTDKIMPQKTKRFVINLETENNGNSEQIIPIAVLAESMKSYPVTAIHMTAL